jgi:hypothetical protein
MAIASPFAVLILDLDGILLVCSQVKFAPLTFGNVGKLLARGEHESGFMVAKVSHFPIRSRP